MSAFVVGQRVVHIEDNAPGTIVRIAQDDGGIEVAQIQWANEHYADSLVDTKNLRPAIAGYIVGRKDVADAIIVDWSGEVMGTREAADKDHADAERVEPEYDWRIYTLTDVTAAAEAGE